MAWFFAADHHIGHNNVRYFCNRPFSSNEEMTEAIIERHNEVVKPEDNVVFLGDFSFYKKNHTWKEIVSRFNGNHIFLKGDHDKWLDNNHRQIYQVKIDNMFIVCCHWAMLTWPRSHYGSVMLFGHHHGKLPEDCLTGKMMDVGVDTNNYYPYSLEEVLEVLKYRPENINLVKEQFYRHI